MKQLRLRPLWAALALFCVSAYLPVLAPITRAQNGLQPAPSAGGYAGDFGSDFGVGRAEPKGLREPVAVAGIRATANGRDTPWLGLRFAAELALQLRAPMRKSVDADGVAQFLAARRIAAWQVSPDAGSATPSAANALRTWPAYRAIPLLVVGEISISGKEDSPASGVRLRLRALRWEHSALRAASPDVLMSAPLGEWPQLPTRAALALLDALRVPLVEDERIPMLRTASPLQPLATPMRLRVEQKIGQMEYQALHCQILLQTPRGEKPFARAARLKSAKTSGSAARQTLAALKKLKFTGDAAALRETPNRWRAYVFAVSRMTNAR